MVFKNTSDHFKNDDEFILMTEKGFFSYDFISSYSVLKDKSLPPIESFYSKLNDSHCDLNDYLKAQKVWNTFNCNTLMDYHN